MQATMDILLSRAAILVFCRKHAVMMALSDHGRSYGQGRPEAGKALGLTAPAAVAIAGPPSPRAYRAGPGGAARHGAFRRRNDAREAFMGLGGVSAVVGRVRLLPPL